jgi:Ca2+:H+ antiporter
LISASLQATADRLALSPLFLGVVVLAIIGNAAEIIAIVGMVFVVNSIAADGETTWFEGVLLVAVYALLAIAFYFATP